MKQKKKKKRRVRTRDWSEKHEDSFTHDLKRHLKTDTSTATQPIVQAAMTDFEPNGLVLSHTKKWAFVLWKDEEHRCRIDEGLMETGATLLAAGDEVLVEQIDDEPVVRAIKPRRTKLSRMALQYARVTEQVIAANIDVLIIVATPVQPTFKPGLIDRYLITAEVGGVTPVLCLNKMDLVQKEPEELQAYRELGITIILTSCKTGTGIDALRDILKDSLGVMTGQSGVGKSSLLNVLEKGLNLATAEISESTKKGKHTTSSARLYTLEGGARVIDTPGLRQLGIWKVSPEDVALYFPELAEHGEHCKFRNCTHLHEPGCAVREAVDTGAIPKPRYASYCRIRQSMEEEQDKY